MDECKYSTAVVDGGTGSRVTTTDDLAMSSYSSYAQFPQ